MMYAILYLIMGVSCMLLSAWYDTPDWEDGFVSTVLVFVWLLTWPVFGIVLSVMRVVTLGRENRERRERERRERLREESEVDYLLSQEGVIK